ncbi:hypothetical protein HGG82_04655 [Marinomonas sp. M1K-6]|uniref:Uncharacterized protein n=1 Tax=Marinomonas profundi TaxID=2726122 RepID=A0A847R0A1_9GAMM|nr:hypothetical protein [Marinomonas profundi]NLQ16911.1 hypothetical protein [Marinomonas profundi]UDV02642.1 hypothetical protein J8N69_13745 [Marinomonas profundi]
MLDDCFFAKEPHQNTDSRILCDLLSMCFDGFFANAALCRRVGNTLDQHVFKKVSSLYCRLAEQLLLNVGALPEDTGTMNPEPGYVAKAYLSALNAPEKHLPNRVMLVNCQVVKRLGKMACRLRDRRLAYTLIDDITCLQVLLDKVRHKRAAAKLEG